MLRRRALFVYAASLAAGVAAPAAAAQERASPRRAPDMQRILDRGRLVVAVAGFAAPPFVTIGADGALGGHDIALAHGMAGGLGLPAASDRAPTNLADIVGKGARATPDPGSPRPSATLRAGGLVPSSRPHV